MNHLFTYGTLMLPEVSEKIFGQVSNEEVVLRNYRRFKLFYNEEELFYPALIGEEGTQTKGILFRNLTNQQLELIDEYEGNEYERRMVQIEAENEILEVWCYVWKPNLHFMVKEEWSIDWFKQNFLADFLSGRL